MIKGREEGKERMRADISQRSNSIHSYHGAYQLWSDSDKTRGRIWTMLSSDPLHT